MVPELFYVITHKEDVHQYLHITPYLYYSIMMHVCMCDLLMKHNFKSESKFEE